MSDIFLGVIAVSVLVMAAIQVAVIVMAARVARRVDRMAARLEGDLRPLLASVQGMVQDIGRATAAFKSLAGMFRGGRSKDARGAGVEEDDPLFIG